MKKIALIQGRLFLCLIISIFLSANFVHSQAPLWIMGNKLVDFSSTVPEVSDLPQPGTNPNLHYTGQIPQKGQSCQFDNNGDLLFFIIDGSIFDAEGYLIAKGVSSILDLTSTQLVPNQVPFYGGDIGITSVPGFCDKFYIFTTSTIENSNLCVLCSVLDMSLQNPNFPNEPERRGSLLSYELNEINGELDYFFSYEGDYTYVEGTFLALTDPVALKNDSHSMELVEVSESKKLLVLSGRKDGMLAFRFEPALIVAADNCSSYNPDFGQGYYYGSVEAYDDWYSPNYTLAAISIDCNSPDWESNNAVSISSLSLNGQISSTIMIPTGTQDFEHNLLTSLEFSPNGEYLWFTRNNAPEIGVINLSNYTVSFPLEGDLSNFAFSELESQSNEQKSDVIYLCSSTALFKITAPNAPENSALEEVSWGGGLEPNTMNVFTSGNNIKSIQFQNASGYNLVNSISANNCCHDFAEIENITPSEINTSNDGTWMDGANPFNNQTSPIRVMGDLIFRDGTVTTLYNMTFEFDADANVIIEKGAKVSMYNTRFTSLTCDAVLWPGVDLLGTTTSSNSIDQNPMFGSDQGYLFMFNSTIENAKIGVDVGTYALNKGGGVLIAINSTFRNNVDGVIFRKYRFTNSSGFVQNKSKFTNCTFITDAHLNGSGINPNKHVQLLGVDKILFSDCSFMNTTDLGVYNWSQRGTGLYSKNSSFTVDGSNDPYWTTNDNDQTTFYKLRYGIDCNSSHLPYCTYTCKEQEFQYCLYGIVSVTTDNVKITLNNFTMPDASGISLNFDITERGIYLASSTGYVVEQNSFVGYDDSSNPGVFPRAVGIWVKESGVLANKIRNNDFNKLLLGTYISGKNKNSSISNSIGLEILCNTYGGNSNDIIRAANSTIRRNQGGDITTINGTNTFSKAGNQFSAEIGTGSSVDFLIAPNNTDMTNYYCHNNFITIPDQSGINNWNVDLLNVIVQPASLSPYDCPNNYTSGANGGSGVVLNPGVVIDVVNQIQLLNEELVTLKQVYSAIIDDNQKEATLDLLNEAFPHESQFYRDLLAQRFPLSDEVLSEVIKEASRLSSWHLTEVLLANSPLSKEILYELENADVLDDFFMSFIYDVDTGSSLRTLMELKISTIETERDEMLGQLILAGVNYESDDSTEVDMPLVFGEYLNQLENLDNYVSLRIRAACMVENGDYAGAQALIADDPTLASYSSIIGMAAQVGENWKLLTEAQIETLWLIYRSEEDVSSDMAFEILQELGLANFEPEPEIPAQNRSLRVEQKDKKANQALLGLWPNPANQTTWLNYPAEADGNSLITIIDPLGRTVETIIPKGNGIIELALGSYESGIYIIQLTAFDKVMDSIKLTVLN
ncbi:MAG: hypothetical protein RLZZ77_1361 [Bacteroidota bacterium]|jgi:hypothetical protein